MKNQPDLGLQSEIDARCPCFATTQGECTCTPIPQKSNYEQMVEAIQNANSWLQHAYKLMESQGITQETVDNEWPIHLADAVHYCSELLCELNLE